MNFHRYKSMLYIEQGIIMINLHDCSTCVVPFSCFVDTVVELHCQLAHIGREKLLSITNGLMWHPSKYRVTNAICSTCPQCQIFKVAQTPVIPPMYRILTSHPFELVAVDLVTFPQSKRGNVCALVLVDHHSKWIAAIPLKNKKSETVVSTLTSIVFPMLPVLPKKVLTDNGSEFTAAIFSETLEDWGVSLIHTTPYKPSSNGAIERVNRSLIGLLNGLQSQSDWDLNLPQAVVIYINTIHQELQKSPASFLLEEKHDIQQIPLFKDKAYRKDGHPKYEPYSVGQLVLKKVPHKGNLAIQKFQAKYMGPFTVAKVHNNLVTYDLISELAPLVTVKAHHSQLREFKQPPKYLSKKFKLLIDHSAMTDCESNNSCDVSIQSNSSVDTYYDSSSSSSDYSFEGFSNVQDSCPFTFTDDEEQHSRTSSFEGFTNNCVNEKEPTTKLNLCYGCFLESTKYNKSSDYTHDTGGVRNPPTVLQPLNETWDFPELDVSINGSFAIARSHSESPSLHGQSEGENADNIPVVATNSQNNELIKDNSIVVDVQPDSITQLEEFIDDYAKDSINSFSGFQPCVSDSAASRVTKLRQRVHSQLERVRSEQRDLRFHRFRQHRTLYNDSDSTGRITRSKGVVPDLPRVQPRPLEYCVRDIL